jgi:Ca2+-binding RTX toxin-like protein
MDIYGTAGVDRLRASTDDQRLLGGASGDTLEGGNWRLGTVLIGGTGSDTYTLVAGHRETLLVLENGFDPLDNWMDDGFLYSANAAATIDGRHLLVMNLNTDQAVLFLDWERPENMIEMWRVSAPSGAHQWLSFSEFKTAITSSFGYIGNVSAEFLGAEGADLLRQEIDQHYRAAGSMADPNKFDAASQMLANGKIATPTVADGSFGLQWMLAGSTGDDAIRGTSGNDLINAIDGSDAVDGAAGDDIIDGGRGSNFLTGGAGADDFFVDGRGVNAAAGTSVWSTITDYAAGESVTVWGWVAGTSRVVETVRTGAAGFEGATWHIDLTGDGRIDASVTLSGVAVGQVASTTGLVEGNGYLLLG